MSVFDDYRRRTYEPSDIAPEQTELATSLRIPFLSSPYPRWNYVTGVVVNADLWFGAEQWKADHPDVFARSAS